MVCEGVMQDNLTGAILLPQDKGQSRTIRLGAAPVHSGPLILLGWPKQRRNTCKYTAKNTVIRIKKELYSYDSSTEQKSLRHILTNIRTQKDFSRVWF